MGHEDDFEGTAKSGAASLAGYEDDFEGSASAILEGNSETKSPPHVQENPKAAGGGQSNEVVETPATLPDSAPTQSESPKAAFEEYEDDEFEDDPEGLAYS